MGLKAFDIREVIQCLTDANVLLKDTEDCCDITHDTMSDHRQRVCDEARKAYGLGDIPYSHEAQENPLAKIYLIMGAIAYGEHGVVLAFANKKDAQTLIQKINDYPDPPKLGPSYSTKIRETWEAGHPLKDLCFQWDSFYLTSLKIQNSNATGESDGS